MAQNLNGAVNRLQKEIKTLIKDFREQIKKSPDG